MGDTAQQAHDTALNLSCLRVRQAYGFKPQTAGRLAVAAIGGRAADEWAIA